MMMIFIYISLEKEKKKEESGQRVIVYDEHVRNIYDWNLK